MGAEPPPAAPPGAQPGQGSAGAPAAAAAAVGAAAGGADDAAQHGDRRPAEDFTTDDVHRSGGISFSREATLLSLARTSCPPSTTCRNTNAPVSARGGCVEHHLPRVSGFPVAAGRSKGADVPAEAQQ
eukprot:9487392-Pyramimonas_sp.AAC.1